MAVFFGRNTWGVMRQEPKPNTVRTTHRDGVHDTKTRLPDTSFPVTSLVEKGTPAATRCNVKDQANDATNARNVGTKGDVHADWHLGSTRVGERAECDAALPSPERGPINERGLR